MKMYTCITNDYDIPADPALLGIQPPTHLLALPVLGARFAKVMSHTYFPEEPETLWVDGNNLILDKEAYIAICREMHADIVVFKHPYRQELHEEFEPAKTRVPSRYHPCMKDLQDIVEQNKELRQLPLYDTGIVYRRKTPLLSKFEMIWWSLICRYSWRDQLSFPIAAAVTGISVAGLTGDIRHNPMITHLEHANDIMKGQ